MSTVPSNISGKQWMITICNASAILRYDYPKHWSGLKKVRVKRSIVHFIKTFCPFDDSYGGYVVYEILADD